MRNTSNTTTFILIKKWFDMVASGDKREEYRALTPFWARRLCKAEEMERFCSEMEYFNKVKHGMTPNTMLQLVHRLVQTYKVDFRGFTDAVFVNGYGKKRPAVSRKITGISIGLGTPQWGAPSEPVFIIKISK